MVLLICHKEYLGNNCKVEKMLIQCHNANLGWTLKLVQETQFLQHKSCGNAQELCGRKTHSTNLSLETKDILPHRDKLEMLPLRLSALCIAEDLLIRPVCEGLRLCFYINIQTELENFVLKSLVVYWNLFRIYPYWNNIMYRHKDIDL